MSKLKHHCVFTSPLLVSFLTYPVIVILWVVRWFDFNSFGIIHWDHGRTGGCDCCYYDCWNLDLNIWIYVSKYWSISFKNIEIKRRLNSTYDCKNACCSWAAHACPPSSHALLHIEVFYRVCWWSLEDYYRGIAYPDILFRYHIFDYMSTTHSIMSTSLQLKNILMFCVPFKVDTLILNWLAL